MDKVLSFCKKLRQYFFLRIVIFINLTNAIWWILAQIRPLAEDIDRAKYTDATIDFILVLSILSFISFTFLSTN